MRATARSAPQPHVRAAHATSNTPAFPDTGGAFAKGFEDIGAKLKELLSPTEYATAQRSIQYAHYTAENVVRAMWQAAEQFEQIG